jgi:lipopolysaccharide/colanic/teichoic acid biosynthesis glycosyltransferase
MTTISQAGSQHDLRGGEQPVPDISADRLPPSPASEIVPDIPDLTEAWLLSWAIGKSGFAVAVAIGRGAAVFAGSHAGEPLFGVHLSQLVPVRVIVEALESLLADRAARGVVLVSKRDRRAPPYREQLHLDEHQHVIRIRRRFRRRHRARPALVGVAWKRASSPLAANTPLLAPWSTLHRLRRAARFGVIRHTVDIDLRRHNPEECRNNFLAQLTPRALRQLAADLKFRKVADFCFAHPTAQVHAGAMLRGPLFIDAGAVIAADHIHIGPGWITRSSLPVTLTPATQQEPAAGRSPLAGDHEQVQLSYFEGPVSHRGNSYEFFKRLFDICFSLAALTVTLPIWLAAALLVKCYDRGPILFGHRRESLHGRPFHCLKFRTMVRNAHALQKKLREANQVDGPQFKIAHDPRITPVGRFLRKTNIDELPQFWNVLKGEMSVVGPRPSPFEENQLCPAWREARLSVRPGITGLWQVSRSRQRGAADFQEWIYYDTQYVERRSFLLDLRIILLTIKEMFGHGQ